MAILVAAIVPALASRANRTAALSATAGERVDTSRTAPMSVTFY
jgi:hypothetical protein